MIQYRLHTYDFHREIDVAFCDSSPYVGKNELFINRQKTDENPFWWNERSAEEELLDNIEPQDMILESIQKKQSSTKKGHVTFEQSQNSKDKNKKKWNRHGQKSKYHKKKPQTSRQNPPQNK